MSRALVTGAGGFIGRQALAALVARGFEVHAADVAEPPADASGDVHWHRADLLDADGARALLEDVAPSHLLHLAWYAVPGSFWASPENLRWAQATLGLLQAFEGRAVVAGSCAEYDWSSEQPLHEWASALRPRTLYGACKGAVGTVATALGHATGRVFFLHGPGEHPDRLVSSVVRRLLAGERAPVSHGDQVRDFMHVADVGGAFAALLDSGVVGPVNIGSGAGVPVRRIVELLAEEAGRPDLVGWGEVPVAPDDPPRIVADARRLHDEVGFAPRFTLEEGLRDTVAWWRARA
ncbi:MAG: dTDP-L-rhamnose 4-epimerase [Solirubrobacteraceae bacterium]|nr:dTDP-L-rhamnose 4-epimerase [Solirubrobacteraceae bacterium]